jgi:phosphoglycerol geranylgeranyltransferase
MTNQTYSNIYNKIIIKPGKKISVLIDPDKHHEGSLLHLIEMATRAGIDFFMVGSSILLKPINKTIKKIRENTDLPLVLFPGNLLQLSDHVDAILLLSLISGRNPELLIGNHVIAAPFIKMTGIETIPTGYMIIGTGRKTSVEYISNTSALPGEKTDIAVATAIAGELLGQKLIYLDAGSGALHPVPGQLISRVKENIGVPLMVGGGIRNEDQIITACNSGADLIVLGNILEEKTEKIIEFSKIVHGY